LAFHTCPGCRAAVIPNNTNREVNYIYSQETDSLWHKECHVMFSNSVVNYSGKQSFKHTNLHSVNFTNLKIKDLQ
jgi:hypothetical protein